MTKAQLEAFTERKSELEKIKSMENWLSIYYYKQNMLNVISCDHKYENGETAADRNYLCKICGCGSN